MMDVKQGFSFELSKRNNMLIEAGYKPPKVLKTGTTIAGVIFEHGVVLGADTRATEGPIVADKNCEKIHYIAKNIFCCGAGTAADTENITALASSQLELHRMQTEGEVRVKTAATILKQRLFAYQGYISAALILGGIDFTGPRIYSIHPRGSADCLQFATMGSGSLAAMGVFESKYQTNLPRQAAIDLVAEAVCAGIFNDLGSGSNVDIVVIERGGVQILRNHLQPNQKKIPLGLGNYRFPSGTTTVIRETVIPVSKKTIHETSTTDRTQQSIHMDVEQ